MRTYLGRSIWMVFLVALPLQARIVFGDWNGEWHSFFLYGTDVIVVILLFVTPRWWRVFSSLPGRWFLLVFLLLGAGSLVGAQDIALGLFRFLFLLKGVMLLALSSVWFRYHAAHSLVGLGVGAFVQAVIGVAQFTEQRDLGLRFLGETILAPSMDGVAVVTRSGIDYLRLYGTTPHPNVAAAVLFVGLFAGWALLPRLRRLYAVRTVGAILLGSFLSLALLLTFSRLFFAAVIGSSVVLLALSFTRSRFGSNRASQRKSLIVLLVIVIFLLGALWPWWSGRIVPLAEEQSVSLRMFYVERALQDTQEHPFLGVGLGNGVVSLRDAIHSIEPWIVQPVHSFYLLIASEMGVPALGAFLLFLVAVFHRIWHRMREATGEDWRFVATLSVLFLALLFVGGFEHLFLTLQQGALLFWVVLGGIIGLLSRRRATDATV